jgi:hypothetical protein
MSLPQRTAYREVPVQISAHLRIFSPLRLGDAGIEPGTAGLQSGVANNEPALLPLSHN